MTETPELPIDSLRRLARSLIYDRDRAEDVVQDAWLAALRRGPEPASLRAWLAEAVRRIARSSRRDELRRTAREERAARSEAVPDVAEAVARIEILRLLLDAVEALPEPYRGAVVLRYFDELPPRAIAHRLGVPVNTARTHVRRGLERLRRDLDGERGQGRQGVLAALAPFAGARPWRLALRDLGRATRTSSSSQEAPMLASKLPLVLALSLAVAATVWLASRPAEHQATGSLVPTLLAENGEPSGAGGQRASTTANSRSPVAPSTSALTAEWTVRGHVLRHRSDAYPSVPLLGRVYADFEPEGELLAEGRFASDEHGDFAWSLAPFERSVTVWVKAELPGHVAEPTWEVVIHGDPAPQQMLTYATPLDAWVFGTVRAPSGAPVPNARVSWYRQRVTAGVNGRFELAVTSFTKSVEVRASAPGFGASESEIDAPAPGERRALELTLGRELALHGRVVDEAGAPLAGVHVEASASSERDVTTDADGRFTVGQMNADSKWVSLDASLDGYAPAHHEWQPDYGSVALELTLARGGRFAGRVLDDAGAPVEGASVGVGWSFDPWKQSTWTDAEGRFALEHVPADFVALEVWRRGWARSALDLTARSTLERQQLELALARGHFLEGRVLDELGAPQSWMRVSARQTHHTPGALSVSDFGDVLTDREGRFRFEGLPEGSLELGGGSGEVTRFEMRVSALDRSELVVRVQRVSRIGGRVLDAATGAPLREFVVRAVRLPDKPSPPLPSSWLESGIAFASADGRWQLEAPRDGLTFGIEIDAAGYAPSMQPLGTGARTELEHALVRGATLRGRVVSSDGNTPVAEARVRRITVLVPLGSPERGGKVLATVTDAEGRFELRDVPAGTMSLVVEADGRAARADGPFAVAGEEALERWIELGPGARLHGRLLDADGHGLAGQALALYGLAVPGEPRHWNVSTAADGAFAFASLPAGNFELHWEPELRGIRGRDLGRLVSLSEGEARELDLQARGHATLRGALTFAGGTLPEVVPIFASPLGGPDGAWPDGVRSAFAVKGRFELDALAPGSYSVRAEAYLPEGKMAFAHTTIEIPAEGEVPLELALEGGG